MKTLVKCLEDGLRGYRVQREYLSLLSTWGRLVCDTFIGSSCDCVCPLNGRCVGPPICWIVFSWNQVSPWEKNPSIRSITLEYRYLPQLFCIHPSLVYTLPMASGQTVSISLHMPLGCTAAASQDLYTYSGGEYAIAILSTANHLHVMWWMMC